MQIDKYFSTPYEGYFVSKDGEVVSFRKTGTDRTTGSRTLGGCLGLKTLME